MFIYSYVIRGTQFSLQIKTDVLVLLLFSILYMLSNTIHLMDLQFCVSYHNHISSFSIITINMF